MARAFWKSPYVSKFESKCPSNTSKLGNMSCLLLESHSMRNYHKFPYKLSAHRSAREEEFVQSYPVGFSFDKILEVLICCWYDAGMKLE